MWHCKNDLLETKGFVWNGFVDYSICASGLKILKAAQKMHMKKDGLFLRRRGHHMTIALVVLALLVLWVFFFQQS